MPIVIYAECLKKVLITKHNLLIVDILSVIMLIEVVPELKLLKP